jgi:hypothetical protein
LAQAALPEVSKEASFFLKLPKFLIKHLQRYLVALIAFVILFYRIKVSAL